MRVMHIGAGKLYGGIERTLFSYARFRGVFPSADPCYVLTSQGRLDTELQSCGVDVHITNAVRISRPWTVARARRDLAALLQQQKPDVAVCHSTWPHAVFGPVVRAAGIPLAFAAHDFPNGRHWLDRLARRTRPDLVIANSDYIKAAVLKRLPNVRIETHYVPVETAAAQPCAGDRDALRSQFGARPETAVIMMACRLERWKGHGSLLSALARLANMGPNLDWQCWIAGGPQRPHEEIYFDELMQAVSEYKLEGRVFFLGQRQDVPRLLAAADIHCQPNEDPEPFGVAFVEALLSGLPVVTTEMGGGAEIVNSQCGLLVPPADSVALARALETLIVNPGLRAALGAAGPGRARDICDPAIVIPHLYRSLEKLRDLKPCDKRDDRRENIKSHPASGRIVESRVI
jgi:glycosyltransferase involved in cell wall biosynthesis